MAMVADFVLGKALEALYTGIEDLIDKNIIFKSLFEDAKSRLDELAPIIRELSQYNEKLDRPKKEMEALEGVLKKGQELVIKCSKIRMWNPFKKFKYAKQLIEWEDSLKRPMEMLKVQETVHVMKIEDTVGDTHRMMVTMLKQQSGDSSSSSIKRLELPPLPPLVVGLDAPLKDLKEKLLGDNGVSMLVLTAPGGCGKTTLATKFCQDEEVKGNFKNNILFITVSQNGNLELVIKRLCEYVGSLVPTFQNEIHMSQWIQTFRKERPNPLLLVLDDIWSGSEFILESFQFETSNYKILVTSRSEFPRFSSSYQLKLLGDDNAMELFYHSASLGEKRSHTLEDLSRKIVKRCNGFPLAITVVGRSLSGQPLEVWRKRESEWSKGSSLLDSETKLFLCLQSSLDALDKRFATVKECYLDLGSFREDRQIPVGDLVDMWAELYDLEDGIAFAYVHELCNRNLAALVDERDLKMEGDDYYGGERFVTQHDLLRELAIYNAKLDPVEQRQRIIIEVRENIPKWLKEQKYQPTKARLLSITITDEDVDITWPQIQLPEAEVLVLDLPRGEFAIPEFVEKMDRLKVVVIDGNGTVINIELLQMLPNLKRISLYRIPINSLTKNDMQFKSLKKLSLTSCRVDIFQSEGVCKLSDAFPNLEEVNFDSCDDSIEKLLAEFCNVIHLKRISVRYCTDLQSLPEEIGNLVNLEELRLRSCLYLRKFSGSVRNLKKLNFLDLSMCLRIELPEDIGELSSLRKLDVRSCTEIMMEELPPSVLDLNQLEEVICDEDGAELWEAVKPSLPNLQIVVIPFWTSVF